MSFIISLAVSVILGSSIGRVHVLDERVAGISDAHGFVSFYRRLRVTFFSPATATLIYSH
jgi:hypothetical protein